MTRRGSVLPTPDDPMIAELIARWPDGVPTPRGMRSDWLKLVEQQLALSYPDASSRDLNVTARSLAPFPLAEKDWQ